MRIGLPKEIKTSERRVAITPEGVERLVGAGHSVVVETDAGVGSGFSNTQYEKSGATISSVFSVWQQDLIVKVKEPLGPEFDLMRPNQVLFTYLHLAASKDLTEKLMQKQVVAYAYETVRLDNGCLPLLLPMSEVAGRLAVQAGAHCLEAAHGGKGILLGGVTGVPPANVLILGAGVAGTNAAMVAKGMGARVTVLDINATKLEIILQRIPDIRIVFSTPDEIKQEILSSDLVISTILVPGAKAPKLITREMLRSMEPGSVFVDVSIDQGGSAETSRATTHTSPTYIEEGVVHYCVANMPGAVPQTSTRALTSATLPYVLELANDPHKVSEPLRRGLNVDSGQVVLREVAEAHGL